MEYQSMEIPGELPSHGVFEIDGLQPGMGTVVGTAMRRVLLSSVPGAAALWMHIKGVSHEFSTVPGVKEDVQELILRMRGLRLRVNDRALHSLSLHVKGRDAYAGDFHGDGSVQILNPLYRIATLNDRAELELDLWVRNSRDRGVQNSVSLPEDTPLGLLRLDPIHSPVERVSVTVDERTEEDCLRLEVWTNGTVSPKEAVDWAGRILSEMTGSLSRALSSGTEAHTQGLTKLPGRPLEELGLSTRSYNRLKRAHFDTLEEILSRSRQELFEIPSLGQKTLTELEKKLAGLGLSFRSDAG